MNIEQKICDLEYDDNFHLKRETIKARGTLGYIIINFSKSFNWLQRKMWKLCFGLEITNLED